MAQRSAVIVTAFALLLAVACDPPPAPTPSPSAPPAGPVDERNRVVFTLDNISDFPATSLVRQVSGPGIVGQADPVIVAPHTVASVTLLVPANANWELVVNPTNARNGGLFGSSEVGRCRGDLPLRVTVSNDRLGWRNLNDPGPIC